MRKLIFVCGVCCGLAVPSLLISTGLKAGFDLAMFSSPVVCKVLEFTEQPKSQTFAARDDRYEDCLRSGNCKD